MALAEIGSLLVIFAAALLRSTFGFGDALLALPLLALLLGLGTATPLVALVSFTLAIGILVQGWQAMDVRGALPLVCAALVGIPLGVLLLRQVDGTWLLRALGVFLIGFGIYRLLRPRLPEVRHPGWALGLGLFGGVLGGAYGLSGPPAVLYGSLRRWPPETFLATMQGYFLLSLTGVLASHAIGGLWIREVFRLYAFSLPLLILALVIGRMLNRRMPEAGFERFLDVFLILLGILVMI